MRAGAALVCFSGDKLLGGELPGPAVALDCGTGSVDELARALRTGEPAVIGRIQHGRLLLDPRTLTDEEADEAAIVVRRAIR